MKRIISLLLVSLCAACLVSSAVGESFEETIVRVSLRNNKRIDFSSLPEEVILDHVYGNGTEAVLYLVDREHIALLEDLDFNVEVLVNEAPLRARETALESDRRRQARDPRQDYQFRFDVYHNYVDLVEFLTEINQQYPEITKLYTIGSALPSGRENWVLEMSDNINEDFNEPGEPELNYVSNIHGDETVGRELALRFIHYMVTGYYDEANSDHSRIRKLINENTIAVMPSFNPDGFERGSRTNSNYVDLNRNFLDQFRGAPRVQQPEALNMVEWLDSRKFITSISFHGGAIVANYPYDGNSDNRNVLTPTPDHTTMQYLCRTYAASNSDMLNSREFPGGIVNGAEW